MNLSVRSQLVAIVVKRDSVNFEFHRNESFRILIFKQREMPRTTHSCWKHCRFPGGSKEEAIHKERDSQQWASSLEIDLPSSSPWSGAMLADATVLTWAKCGELRCQR
eukprot:scaffold103_cov193-Alexandrium_tamarense.AAC.29